ncbi:MAG: hypothetical protein LN413_07260 [Candidatus Thermoplasmatota archaeon]|nr:hypothetical protein [Candidatus Thermoplasmatota archaeon]
MKKNEWSQLKHPAFKQAVGVPEDEDGCEGQVECEEGMDAQGQGAGPDVEEYPLSESRVARIGPLSGRESPS